MNWTILIWTLVGLAVVMLIIFISLGGFSFGKVFTQTGGVVVRLKNVGILQGVKKLLFIALVALVIYEAYTHWPLIKDKDRVGAVQVNQSVVVAPVGQWSVAKNIQLDYSFSGVYLGADDPKMQVRVNGWNIIPTTGHQLSSLQLGDHVQILEYMSLEDHSIVVSFSTGPKAR